MTSKNFIKTLFILFITFGFAQQNQSEILFTIEDNKYTTDEFVRIYKKNLDLVKDDSQKNLDQYLELFLGYKLKVNKANKLGLQNNSKYKNELSSYRNQLSKSYINDSKVTNSLLEEAYQHTLKEVRASHILITLEENVKGADTLPYYEKIMNLKKMIDSGTSFETIATEYSQDPSVKDNKGDLGYFSAFRMVYPFEKAAYKTQVGQVSMPFRSRFGYHILKVNDIRNNKGDVTVAHIMILKPTEATPEAIAKAKETINNVYSKLQQNESFEALVAQFSEDKTSIEKGGVLQRFGTGKISSIEFENEAFSLQNINDFSKPFESQFGWHIVKLIEKHPIKSFEEMKADLDSKIRKDERSKIITNSLTNKLKDKYTFEKNTDIYKKVEGLVNEKFYSQSWEIPKDKLDNKLVIAKINKTETIEVGNFLNFIKNQQKNKLATKPISKLVAELYESFKGEELFAFYNKNLENEFLDFKNIMDEYRDGILLFDLMENEIWNKSKNDTIGLQEFYNKNQAKYFWKKRYDVDIFSSTDKKILAKVNSFLKKGKNIEYIKSKLNVKDKINVMIKSGLFEEDNEIFKKSPELKSGINKVYKEGNYYFITNVKEEKPSQAKTLVECKSKAINDYQQYLEANWVDELKKEFSYKINYEVFQKVKEQLK